MKDDFFKLLEIIVMFTGTVIAGQVISKAVINEPTKEKIKERIEKARNEIGYDGRRILTLCTFIFSSQFAGYTRNYDIDNPLELEEKKNALKDINNTIELIIGNTPLPKSNKFISEWLEDLITSRLVEVDPIIGSTARLKIHGYFKKL